eukprot:TRINITY_DN5725_c0_g1_i1.p1 TRINITY_DN5725_c0_g1~~TRINITY_DN5725_c0_g1_i1.p1  ORF type:complete len:405 (+),score=78.10 TRINITY_DN5725_c0_g1_i1:105-1319(+)
MKEEDAVKNRFVQTSPADVPPEGESVVEENRASRGIKKFLTEKVIRRSSMMIKSLRVSDKIAKGQDKLKDRITNVPFMRFMDKLSFILGLLLIVITEYLVLDHQELLPHFYTLLMLPLMIYRFFAYHKANYHYFMLDFCYYMQIMSILLIYFLPHDVRYFKLFFGLANGPLLNSVIMWANKLILHDIDKLTSIFIHIYPPLLSYAFRWSSHYDPEWIFAVDSPDNQLDRWDFICMLVGYFVWQIFYWVKVELMDKKKLRENKDLVTSARWLGEVRPHAYYVWVKKMVPRAQPEMTLILTQLVYTAITLCFIPYMYSSKVVHTFFIGANMLSASWLGANFYFESFAQRYTSRLQAEVERQRRPAEENQAITKYCPNSRRSFIVFFIYFSSGMVLMYLSFVLTIWL